MSIDKTLQKIKVQVGELGETLQSFVHESIQPSAGDCDQLRKQMNDLLELLAVYKYHKTHNEIEPGFNLHAKVSEKAAITEEIKEMVHDITEPVQVEKKPEPEVNQAPEVKVAPLLIGINDKFRFINELFSHNNSEYNIVLEQLQNLRNWHDTEVYFNSLKSVYGWKDNSETVKYFYSLVRKRFE